MPGQKDRYRTLLELFNQGEELTYDAIAERLGIGKRQAERLIDRAKEDGVPIAKGEKKRPITFFVPEKHRQSGFRVHLSQDELLALTVVADAARGTLGSTTLGNSLFSGIQKLIEQFPKELIPLEIDETSMHWHFSSNPTAEIDPEIFRALLQAIREEKQIVIDYFSASRGKATPNRRLDPYALALRGSSWLLVAWCHDRKTFLDFSIPAITNLQIQTEDVFRDDTFNLEKHFQGRFGATGGKKTWLVKIKIEPDRVPYFKRKRYHPSQNLTEHPDGSGLVEYTVSGLEDIRSFAQSWGVGITVIDPPELVEIMQREARELTSRYG